MSDERKEVLATLVSANFYPHLDEHDPNREFYNGNTCLWTFEMPKDEYLHSGIWRLTFERTLADEATLGNPVYGKIRPKDDALTERSKATKETGQ